jgi:hypothetical protein
MAAAVVTAALPSAHLALNGISPAGLLRYADVVNPDDSGISLNDSGLSQSFLKSSTASSYIQAVQIPVIAFEKLKAHWLADPKQGKADPAALSKLFKAITINKQPRTEKILLSDFFKPKEFRQILKLYIKDKRDDASICFFLTQILPEAIRAQKLLDVNWTESSKTLNKQFIEVCQKYAQQKLGAEFGLKDEDLFGVSWSGNLSYEQVFDFFTDQINKYQESQKTGGVVSVDRETWFYFFPKKAFV